ncbi:MAG: N-acetylmuramoyl-L-alanine amidase [Armatimonadetes bacterium]|nr:N-acetylmuramoyl-L-alanine amidase [Armatimonadota bacterium]
MKPATSALLVSAALILSVTSSFGGSRISAPTIVPKDEWGSMREGDRYQDRVFDPYSQGPLGDPVAITIHHTYIPAGANPPDPAEDRRKLREIQEMHVGKGWGDIGYHLLIGSDGTVYQGRPLGWMGTHSPPNTSNIGVNVIGDFHEKEYPSQVQIESLARLLSWLCDTYDIDPTANAVIFDRTAIAVGGHRDWNATACPGDHLYAPLADIRNRVRADLLAGHPPYDARPSVLQFYPTALLAGREYTLDLHVRNVGYLPWSHFNRVRLDSLKPDALVVPEPSLSDGETVGTLANRTWTLAIRSPAEPGPARLAVRMSEADRPFGGEIGWDAEVLSPAAFISEWLTAGAFTAQAADGSPASPDALIARDFFAGQPLDVMDTFDEASEKAHGYSVTDEYSSGERSFRGPDGQRVSESGRYFRGEENLTLSLTGHKDGNVILRRLIDAGDRDQRASITVNGEWRTIWSHPGRERYRLWKEVDTVIPYYHLAGKREITVSVKSLGTVQYGCNSFRYALLDSGEPLAAPRLGEKVGDGKWESWKSHDGLTDLSSAFKDAQAGAAYLAVYVKSPRTQRVEFRTGYAGRLKAWVNGELAVSSLGGKPDFPDTESGSVLLKSGWNRLLVKVVLDPGAKNLYARFCRKDGSPAEGLKVSFDPNDRAAEEVRTAKAESAPASL